MTTDSRGRAIFRNVPFGDYEFVCQMDTSLANLTKKRAKGERHRPTIGQVSVADTQTTKHPVQLLPVRQVRMEYAEVVPNADLLTLTSRTTRKGTITEAVTPTCSFPLMGSLNTTQSLIRVESANNDQALQLSCLPSGTILDLGVVPFDGVGEASNEWTSAATVTAAEVHADHVYLIQHQGGRRFKLRVTLVN